MGEELILGGSAQVSSAAVLTRARVLVGLTAELQHSETPEVEGKVYLEKPKLEK